jgi:hypothetical protein
MAEDAAEGMEKWVTQLWLSSALPPPPGSNGKKKIELPPSLKPARRGNPGRR